MVPVCQILCFSLVKKLLHLIPLASIPPPSWLPEVNGDTIVNLSTSQLSPAQKYALKFNYNTTFRKLSDLLNLIDPV